MTKINGQICKIEKHWNPINFSNESIESKKWGQKFAYLENICWKGRFLKTTSNEWKDPK